MPRLNACSIGSPRVSMLLLWPFCWRLLTRLTSASSVSPMTRTSAPAPGLNLSSRLCPLSSRPCPLSSTLFRELRLELGAGLFVSSAQRQASQAIMRNKPSRGNITKYYKYLHLHLPWFHTTYYHNATGKDWSSELQQPRHSGSLLHWWPGAGCAGGGCISRPWRCPGAWSRHYRTRGGPGDWAGDTRGPGPGPGERGQRRWTGRDCGWAEPDWK